MSRLHSGKRQRPQAFLFIRHRHGLRHMAFSITISTQCHISVLSDTKCITWISLPMCGKQLISVFVVCAWVCPSLSIYVIVPNANWSCLLHAETLYCCHIVSLVFSHFLAWSRPCPALGTIVLSIFTFVRVRKLPGDHYSHSRCADKHAAQIIIRTAVRVSVCYSSE